MPGLESLGPLLLILVTQRSFDAKSALVVGSMDVGRGYSVCGCESHWEVVHHAKCLSPAFIKDAKFQLSTPGLLQRPFLQLNNFRRKRKIAGLIAAYRQHGSTATIIGAKNS